MELSAKTAYNPVLKTT